MNLNKVFIIGRLAADPESRTTQSGQTVVTLRLATNRVWNNRATGEKQEQVEFHNIVAGGRQAEIINQYLHKGSSILVEGRLQTRSWQDTQGGKHFRTEIVAEQIQLGPKPQGGSGGGMAVSGGMAGATSRQPAAGGSDGNPQPASPPPMPEPMPVIELPEEEEEFDIKDIPF